MGDGFFFTGGCQICRRFAIVTKSLSLSLLVLFIDFQCSEIEFMKELAKKKLHRSRSLFIATQTHTKSSHFVFCRELYVVVVFMFCALCSNELFAWHRQRRRNFC